MTDPPAEKHGWYELAIEQNVGTPSEFRLQVCIDENRYNEFAEWKAFAEGRLHTATSTEDAGEENYVEVEAVQPPGGGPPHGRVTHYTGGRLLACAVDLAALRAAIAEGLSPKNRQTS